MDRRNRGGYNSRGFSSSDSSNYRRSLNGPSGNYQPQSRPVYHPYERRSGAYDDRRRDGGYNDNRNGYGSHRGGGYDSRRSGGYEDRRSGGYESHRGRGGFGNIRGRGPGTGRAKDDDSITESISAIASKTISLSDLPPMAFKKEMTALVNGYEISTKNAKVVYQYCIEWSAINKKGRKFDLNTQTKAAHTLQLKQVALFTVFDQLLKGNKGFFGFDEDDSKFVYDTGSIFFAHQKLLEKDETREFVIDIGEFSQEAKDYYKDLKSATAVISLVRQIDLNSLDGDLANDRPIIQYLELAFSQEQRKSGKYFCFTNEFFEKESAEAVQGIPYVVLKSGCLRSIRLIREPSDKKLVIHLVPKKTAFYGTTSLEEFIEQTIQGRIDNIWREDNLQRARDAVKNLTVCTTHMEHNHTFVISGLSNDSAELHTFEFNGEMITVAAYFFRQYSRRLKYPALPCVLERGKNYYPLEVLRIAEVQKIPKAKQKKALTSKITDKCSFDPAKNVAAIADQADKADIRMSNDYIKNTGCRVDAQRLLSVPSKQLYPPCIVFKNTQKTLNSGLFGMLKGDQFVKPAFVKKLACVFASRYIKEDKAEDFVNEFLERLELYGVKIQEHKFITWEHAGYDCGKLDDLVERGYTYVIVVGDDDDLHHGIKLMELRTRLVTQHIMTSTLEKAKNTLYDNLAFKFNLRAGGLNWTLSSDPELIKRCDNVDILKSLMDNTMLFGIDLSHPFGTDEPTCVGFASNLDSTIACTSMGDFGYQSAREKLVNASLLESKFTAAINAYYLKNARYPSWIVVFRAGLSEGEICKIQRFEIPVLKNAIHKLLKSVAASNQIEIKLTCIMSHEKTNYRLFKDVIDANDKSPLQNLPPGTCVSEVIVSQTRTPSFILISQRPQKGTARPTVYYVLDGANVVSLDHLQYLTYCLCYSNTNNSPTAMCGPLESAADLSKRARNNLKEFNRQEDLNDGGARNISSSKKGGEKNLHDDQYLATLNERFKSAIIDDRFWA